MFHAMTLLTPRSHKGNDDIKHRDNKLGKCSNYHLTRLNKERFWPSDAYTAHINPGHTVILKETIK